MSLPEAEAGPRAHFSTLSVPGLKTTLNESCFRSIPNYETSSVRLKVRGGVCVAVWIRVGALWAVPERGAAKRPRPGCRKAGFAAQATSTMTRPQYWKKFQVSRFLASFESLQQGVQKFRLQLDTGNSKLFLLGRRLMVGQVPLEHLTYH